MGIDASFMIRTPEQAEVAKAYADARTAYASYLADDAGVLRSVE